MQKASFIALISLLLGVRLFSQDIHQWKTFADEQAAAGNKAAALKAYQRVLFFDEHKQYNDVYARLAELYFEEKDFDNALTYYDFAWKLAAGDSLRMEYSFLKTLCHLKAERFYLGLAELYDLPDRLPPYFEAKRQLYLGICHYGLEDHDEAKRYFSMLVDSSDQLQVEVLFTAFEKQRHKYDPDRLEIMSIFLPGLGQTVAGDPLAGINALFLLGGIATYSYYTALSYSFLDGALVLVSWFYRYYTGSHKKAYQLGLEKQAELREAYYLRLLGLIAGPEQSD